MENSMLTKKKKKKKKKAVQEHERGALFKHDQQQELEVLKAVAQAWYSHSHSHSSSSRATSEFDAHRLNFEPRPSRFRIEATSRNNSSASSLSKGSTFSRSTGSGYWDFRQSLWDSYELLAVSRKLESGLVLVHPFSDIQQAGQGIPRLKESKNSLRNLFNLVSSRRFNESHVPR